MERILLPIDPFDKTLPVARCHAFQRKIWAWSLNHQIPPKNDKTVLVCKVTPSFPREMTVLVFYQSFWYMDVRTNECADRTCHSLMHSSKKFLTIFPSRSHAPFVVEKIGSINVGSLKRPPCLLSRTVLLASPCQYKQNIHELDHLTCMLW